MVKTLVGDQRFSISLAQWSFHRAFFDGDLDAIEFPVIAANDYGIHAVEYVNAFFPDRLPKKSFLSETRSRCSDSGVQNLLIMVDREGDLGDASETARTNAIENHMKWLDAAAELGCHSIRVNAASSGSPQEQHRRAADGLGRLTQRAMTFGLNVIVENHGGLSSNGQWLSGVINAVGLPSCGTLPDFGNFLVDAEQDLWYDRYQGVDEMMPFAKAVSAKSHDFSDSGEETGTDFSRMIEIVLSHGYDGFIGIEYEGDRLSEHEGVVATRELLQRLQ
jgi:sugar phosphate isomerase/epimerase